MANHIARAGRPYRWLWVALALTGLALGLFLRRNDPAAPLAKPGELHAALPPAVAASKVASAPPVSPKPAAPQPGRIVKLEDLDRRQNLAAPAETPARAAALAKVRAAIPGVEVQFDPLSGAASYVMATGRLLSKPAPAGAGPYVQVGAFLDQNAGLFGEGSAVLDHVRTIREDLTAHNGLRTVVWQQELDGIPLYDTILKANLTKDGQLITLGSHLLPDPARAAGLPQPERVARIQQPALDAGRAIASAAANLGDRVDPAEARSVTPARGIDRVQRFEAPGLSDVQAGLTWLPMSARELRLAWDVTLMSVARNAMYRVVVDAGTGDVLVRTLRTADAANNATYRVYVDPTSLKPLDSPSPLSPAYASPGSAQPSLASRSVVTLSALSTNASPNGWINAGGTATYGNNVDAHLDILNVNPGWGQGTHAVSSSRNFDFPLDLTQAPSAYRSAALTQVFYACNWFHDRFYQLGFTETAGNFQQNNFGRGGEDGDAMLVDTQDGSGSSNGNFSTPADGLPGRLQVFLFPSPAPDRDGALDMEVILHEATHGVSGRLVGGGIGITAQQSRGLGEGWSDFVALSLLSDPTDDVRGNYPLAAYACYKLAGRVSNFTSNYYFGTRRYPYSTEMTRNPLTLRDIDPTQAGEHPTVPLSPLFESANDSPGEIHCVGEVWCQILWEARANLITRYGGAVGNELMLRLVTDGMKLSPVNPTFTQARDAIIQADLVDNGGANWTDLWNAFVKRGIGASAVAPSSDRTAGVVEAYDFPDQLSVTPADGLSSSGPVGGSFVPAGQAFVVSNTSTTKTAFWSASANVPWLTLSATGGTLQPGGAATVNVTFNSAANALTAGTYVGTLSFTNPANGFNRTRQVSLVVGQTDYFTEQFEYSGNDTAHQSWLFTPNGTPNFYAVRRSPATTFPVNPAGGTALPLEDDNSALVTLAAGAKVKLYNGIYSSFYVNSNGCITFGAREFFFDQSLANHFAYARVSGLYADLVPSPGTVSWKQLADRVAVTYQNVLDYGTDSPNTFQIELFFDGRIRITCLNISLPDGIIGLSAGQGLPADYKPSDFTAYPSNSINLALPTQTTEGLGTLRGQGLITLSSLQAANTSIQLLSSDTTKLTVPSSIVINAGQSVATFDLTVMNNTLLDGTQNVVVTATSPAFDPGSASIAVHDNEVGVLSVVLPGSTSEGIGAVQGTVLVNSAPAAAVAVALTSSDPTAVMPPPTVIIPAGQSSATFPLAVLDNNKIDGTRNAIVTAHVANWTDGSATIAVQDNEDSFLTVGLPSEVQEGTATTGNLTLSGTLAAPLTVSLASSDAARLAVPATITIPAGALSATFALAAPDNDLKDGSALETVTATAANFTGASATTMARDDDPDHFVVSPIASPQVRGAPITVIVTAEDATNLTISSYTGAFTLSATSQAGSANVTAFAPLNFAGGSWTGEITVDAFATGVIVSAADGSGLVGASNPFDVGVGPLDHFTWSAIPNPQLKDFATMATLTAQDVANNTVTSFNGSANLSATAGVTVTSVQVLTYTRYADLNEEYPRTLEAIGTYFPEFVETSFTGTDAAGLQAALTGKHVFLIVEQENATSTQLTSLSSSWSPVLSEFVSGGGVVIVCSHHREEHAIVSGFFNVTKLGYLSSATLIKPTSTFLNADVSAPFAANWISLYSSPEGIVSLKDSSSGNAVVLHKNYGRGHVVIIGSDYYALGTEMDHIISNAVQWAQTTAMPITIAPATTGPFANGLWSGPITLSQAALGVRLHADVAGASGVSNAFDVQKLGTLSLSLPAGATEGDGDLNGTVNITPAPASDLTVNVSSSLPGKVSVPATVVIPRGQTSVSVQVTIIDDGLVDGTMPVTITAAVPGYESAVVVLSIVDNEAPAVGTPVLDAEPAISGGSSNKVSWAAVYGAELYEAQVSSDNFSSVRSSSGWQPATYATFTGLTDGVTFSYRVRARRTLSGDVITGDWSAPLSSMQDASGPVVTPTDPTSLVATQPSMTISGTANDPSGIRALIVGGVAAISSDGFAHWTVTLDELHVGTNTINVVASDNASPANIATSTIEITGTAPRDTDGNGLPDDWETYYGVYDGPLGSAQGTGVDNFTAYALGLDPNAVDQTQLPSISMIIDPSDQLPHLTYSYRRRIDTVALTYSIQISSDLTHWSAAGNQVEALGRPTENGDGVTETVTVRLKQPMRDENHRYLRLQVSTD